MQYRESTQDFVQHAEGRYCFTGGEYHYDLKDHLGNVQAVVSDATPATPSHVADYLPFGLKMRMDGGNYPFGYQGEFAEDDPETGFNHFESRQYDPVIGRWMAVDPARQV